MDITFLGHSAFRIDCGEAHVLIDPFLTGNPMFEASGLSMVSVQQGVTHVVVTHGHNDHVGDAAAICKATGATLSSNYEVCTVLGGHGVNSVQPGNSGGSIDLGSFRLAFTPALHSSSLSGEAGPVYMGNPMGVVLNFAAEPGKPLYHMGDTAIFGDMALIEELYHPAIGIVPIGDRFTMGAKQAALACTRYFKFETVFPCHYATFGLLDPTADAFVAAMKGQDVRVPKPGQRVSV